jgi:hypothetical protein
MLGFSTYAFRSAEHIAEYDKFYFTYLFGDMFFGFKAYQHS